MKVLHIGLSSHYTDGMLYQDNCLAEMNASDGHEVIYITDTYKYIEGSLKKIGEENTTLKNGVNIIRLEYEHLGCGFLSKKIQKTRKLVSLLEEIRPDTILYHDPCGYGLLDVARYVSNNPNTLFYLDNHNDFNNTAKNFVSRIAHKYINGFFLHKALPYINKILYITEECRIFLKELYNIPDEKLEYFPLGGYIEKIERQNILRKKLLDEWHLETDTIIIAHSGKLDVLKRTRMLLNALYEIDYKKIAVFIFGEIPPDQHSCIMPLIRRDSRIHFLGWKNSKECIELLDAVDLYCQPGSQSATAQIASCCGCALLLYPHISYEKLYGELAFYVKDEKDICNVINNLINDRGLLEKKKKEIFAFAQGYLSYSSLSKRYLKK